MKATDWQNKHFSYFQNTKCEYFPCHEIKAEEFNCLFCYCPLYEQKNCGGVFKYLKNGCKDCSDCAVPHKRSNFGYIIERIKRGSGDRVDCENNSAADVE